MSKRNPVTEAINYAMTAPTREVEQLITTLRTIVQNRNSDVVRRPARLAGRDKVEKEPKAEAQ